MPPAISDGESDQEVEVPLPAKKNGRDRKSIDPRDEVDEDENEDEDVNGTKDANGDAGEDDDEEEDDLDEEEYVVEKVTGHIVNDDGEPLFHVKWEGYEKKSDMTWEPEDNLRENASTILDEYLEKIGGREKIFEETATALKTKKRGRRPSSGASQAAAKRSKKNGHPADAEAPQTARSVQWKPPAGSWEEHIAQLDACEDEESGKLMVYLTWNNGAKTQHETAVIYKRCPQKMLQFYERHVRIIKNPPAEGTDDELKP